MKNETPSDIPWILKVVAWAYMIFLFVFFVTGTCAMIYIAFELLTLLFL